MAVVISATFPLFGIDWSSRAAGTYEWNDTANWTGGVVPTAADTALLEVPTGNQTINIPQGTAVEYLNVLNKRTSGSLTGEGVRTITGMLTTVSNDFRTGSTVLKGRIDVTGTNQGYTRVGTSGSLIGILEIADGGIFCATNDYAIILGRHNSGSTQTAMGSLLVHEGGQLFLGGGGNVSNSGLMMGRADGTGKNLQYAVRRSSYFQDGGYALIRKFFVGLEKNSHAGMTIAGGVLELPFTAGTRYRIGNLGYGIFQQLGGEIYVNTNITTFSSKSSMGVETFEIGSNQTSAAGRLPSSAYLCGGTFVCGDVIAIQGQWSNAGIVSDAAPSADLTIDRDADVTARSVRVGGNATTGAAVLNLNGGRLSAIYVRRNSLVESKVAETERQGANEVNGNGGTLRINHPTNPNADLEYQFSGIDRVMVYPKGLTIQSDVSTRLGSSKATCPLRTAKGYGVESVTIDSTGAGFYGPPLVTLEGGSGSNATAIALIDYVTHRLTNIVITCRGEGYAADDELTIKMLNANETASVVSQDKCRVTLTPNTPGTLVKTGANRLVMWEQPDFDGTYEVRHGLLLQATAGTYGSTNVAAIVVGGTDATFQCGSGTASANTAHWNPVNTNATLTLGTEYGPGKFTLPGATSGQTKPFQQSLASLTVNGTGNVIAGFYDDAIGFKLSFGTIICAEGAKVTIPRWDSTFKVYVTGMPAGQFLKGVVFDGTAKYAMVGDDGQLIPAPQGLVISIR